MYALTKTEYDSLRTQFASLKKARRGGISNITLLPFHLAIEKLLNEKAVQVSWEERERIGFYKQDS